jgi:hypothetical protein
MDAAPVYYYNWALVIAGAENKAEAQMNEENNSGGSNNSPGGGRPDM